MEDIEKMTKNYAEYMTLSALPEAVVRQCSRFDTGATLLKKGHEYLQCGEEENAAECYRKAAEKGEADAYLALSICYEYGIGMPADPEQSDAMIEKAVKLRRQGIYEAMGAETYIDSEEENIAQAFETGNQEWMNYEKKISSKKYPKKETACIMSSKFKDILFPPSSLNKKQEMAELKQIVFGDKINKRAFNGYYKDISASGDGSVIGWVEDTVLLHIEGNGKVIAPTNCRYLFKDMNIESFKCNGAFDTREVTDMRAMFDGCKKLTKLDLSGFDTGKVKDMRRMFFGCENLTKLDLSGFDTGHVIDMSSMFADCKNLIKLDLSGFDTRLVADMSSMFSGCRNLTELDLSSFDTRLVLDMRSMFSQCRKLTKLYINGFDFGNGSIKENMFDGCYTLPQQLKTAGKY